MSGCPASCDTSEHADPPTSTTTPLNVEVDETLQNDLEVLGYAKWAPVENPANKGVVLHNTEKSWEGINLLSARHLAKAELIDMQGKTLHTWEDKKQTEGWFVVRPFANGDLLTLTKETSLARYDRDSNILWKTELVAHHDFDEAPDGTLYVLTRHMEYVENKGFNIPILADDITVLAADGSIQEVIPLTPIYLPMISDKRLQRLRRATQKLHDKLVARLKSEGVPNPETSPKYNKAMRKLIASNKRAGDLFHTNTVHYVRKTVRRMCRRGALLLSVRNLDRVSCLDLKTRKEVWGWGPGEIERQHHPTILDDGTVLLFDNGTRQLRSRALILDPVSKQIIWEYEHKDFFSETRGGVQRLPNGNILIASSDQGRVFEVTQNREVVWDFYTPLIEDGKRSVVYRFPRYPLDFITPKGSPQHP